MQEHLREKLSLASQPKAIYSLGVLQSLAHHLGYHSQAVLLASAVAAVEAPKI